MAGASPQGEDCSAVFEGVERDAEPPVETIAGSPLDVEDVAVAEFDLAARGQVERNGTGNGTSPA